MFELWVRQVFLIGCGFAGFLRFGLHLNWGRGNNLDSILLISPVADLSDPVSPLPGAGMQVYNPFSGCRNDMAIRGDGIPIHLP
jgi:hypothetical protein